MRSWVLFVLLIVAFPSILAGQTTFATITGTVTDTSGAVVPNVTVTATHVATGVQTTAQSNDAGVYTLAQLKEGEYTLRAKGAGFKEFVATGVLLTSRDYRRIDIQLEVGAIETAVEVSAGATLIETETARITDTKSAYLMNTLPLNTRGLWAYLALAPNVLQAGGGSSTIRFAGSRGNQSHWAIDGTTFSDGVDETQIGPLANFIESFQEVKVDISNNTAEFGTIGQVTLISKSGTNSLHGSAFDYYSTPWFRARNPFQLARGTGVSHLLGGSVGGPVYLPKIYSGRNRSFFFFSIEKPKGSATSQGLNPTVPLAPWRQGDFSALSTLVRDPMTGQQFAGNRIPQGRLNQTALRFQDRFYPLPNFGSTATLVSQNYRELKVRPRDPTTYLTARGDHNFTQNDRVFARYTWQRLYNNSFEGNLPTIGQRFQQRTTWAFSTSYTHVFSSNLLNEFRYGRTENNNPIVGPINGPDFVREFGIQGLAPDLPNISGLTRVTWTGIGLTAIDQVQFRNPGFRNFLQEYQDHVSIFKGRHNIRLGANLTRIEWDDRQANANLFGTVNFPSQYTGHPYADFLLGLPTSGARAFAPLRVDRLRWQYDFFVADDWKITPKLTLNAGLRYEFHPLWQEEHGLASMFDIGSGKIVVQDGSLSKASPLMPRGYVDVVEAKTLGLPGKTIVHNDRNNFVPRLGLAYRPWGNNTVFRAGYGIFYDVVTRNISHGSVPYVINEPTFTNPAANPVIVLPRVFPATSGAGPTTVGLPAAINTRLQVPYSMQYNFTIEHQRWQTAFRASYIGTNTRQGDWSYNYNSPVPDNRLFVDKPRPFPNYPGISYFTNGAGHQYHGFIGEAERQLSRGLYLQASWTWARDIGDLERGQSPENPFNRERERAVWLDIPTHRVTANGIYQLPFGRGRRFLNTNSSVAHAVFGGWEISAIYGFYSGQFLTPSWTGPDPVGIAFTSSRTPATVTLRPDHLRNANLPDSQRTVSRWFDPSAFDPPDAGRFGTSAKGVIKGPGVNIWHTGLFKTFGLTEGLRLRWEWTATNTLNHPNWSNPATNISQPQQVGVISGVGGVNGASTGDQPGPRSMRMGLRLEW